MRRPIWPATMPVRFSRWRSAVLDLALIIVLPLAVLLLGAVATAQILPPSITPPMAAGPSGR